MFLMRAASTQSPTRWLEELRSASGVLPVLAFDFVGNRYAIGNSAASLTEAISTTRSGSANYFDSADGFSTAATGVARIGRISPGRSLGLMSEASRTNAFASPSAPATQSVTVTAQAYTLSFHGTGSITWSGAASGSLSGTGANDRVEATFTPAAGTLTLTCSGSLAMAQLEAGVIATSWISGARNSDLHKWTASSFAKFNAAAGTFLVKSRWRNLGTSANLFGLSDNTNTNRLLLNMTSGGITQAIVNSSGGANSGSMLGPTLGSTEADFRSAFAYASNNCAVSFNGDAVVSDSTVDLPVGIDRAFIGSGNLGTAPSQLPIGLFAYWDQRLPNSDLVAF